jgi:hypothetical protein
LQGLGARQILEYLKAEDVILKWQADQEVTATIVLLGQPTIVNNTMRQQNAHFGSKGLGRPATANEAGVPVRVGSWWSTGTEVSASGQRMFLGTRRKW